MERTTKRVRFVGEDIVEDTLVASFGSLRETGGSRALLRLYSWLTPLDRLRLRQVSVEFYNDTSLCLSVQGVYGPDNVSLLEAVQQVEDYLEFSSTPESLQLDECYLPPCWAQWGLEDWIYYKGIHLYDRIHRLYNTEDGGSYQLEGLGGTLHKGLKNLNSHRRHVQRNVAALREKVLEDQSVAERKYNMLLALLLEFKLPVTIFLNARRTRLQDYGICEYQIIRNNNGGEPEFISHLRPGLKLSFPHEEGTVESSVIKKCDSCRKIKDNVESERCGKAVGSLECFHEKSVCRKCTTKGVCYKCGHVICFGEVHFEKVECAAVGCTNLLCDSDMLVPIERLQKFDDPQFDTVCSYRSEQTGEIYCEMHKPDGAVPNVDHSVLELRRLLQQQKGL